MTPTQVNLVQESFRTVAAHAAETGRLFYDEFFRLAPDRRALFPTELSAQKHKFVQMLGEVVKNLDRISQISEDLVDLGYRHLAYDVDEEDYKAFGDALLRTLEKLLGAGLTPEMRDAWAAAYDMLARLMQEAGDVSRSTEDFFGRVIRDVMVAQYGVALRSEAKSGRASLSREIDSGKVIRLS
jgi:hemoglobin-like flavoprotein